MSSQPFDQMLMQAQSFNQISSNDGIRQQIIDTIVDATCDGEIIFFQFIHYFPYGPYESMNQSALVESNYDCDKNNNIHLDNMKYYCKIDDQCLVTNTSKLHIIKYHKSHSIYLSQLTVTVTKRSRIP